MPMPGLSERPGLAVIIAQKRNESAPPDESKIAAEMAEEIMDDFKSGDPKRLGASLMNFVRYVMDERE